MREQYDQKLVVYEPICRNLEHVPVNAEMIRILDRALAPDEILFYGEKSHIQAVEDALEGRFNARFTPIPIDLPPRHSQFPQRIFKDAAQILGLFKTTRSFKAPIFLVLSCNASVLFALKALGLFSPDNLQIQVVLHSILARITGWRSRNPLVRMGDFRSALTLKPHANIQYIVLEKAIRTRVLETLPRLEKYFHLLDHPLPQTDMHLKKTLPERPLSFGFLGIASPDKGFPLFAKTAGKVQGKNHRFYCIGSISKECPELDMSGLDTLPASGKLDRKVFRQKLNKLHYICLPYETEHYQWSASGVLLDAVCWEKPVIARSVPMIKDLFTRFGNIGYLFDSDDEYYDIIENLSRNFSSDSYTEQVGNMKKIKAQRSLDNLAAQYLGFTRGRQAI